MLQLKSGYGRKRKHRGPTIGHGRTTTAVTRCKVGGLLVTNQADLPPTAELLIHFTAFTLSEAVGVLIVGKLLQYTCGLQENTMPMFTSVRCI